MSRRTRSVWSVVRWFGIMVSALFAACGDDGERTEIIVAVYSDLEPGRELSQVKVETYDVDGNAMADGATFRIAEGLPSAEEVRLPFKVTVYKRTKDAFLLRVAGYGPNHPEPIIDYKVHTTFRKGRTLLLKVVLGRVCLERHCGVDSSCYSGGESDEPAGTCGEIASFDDLPEVSPRYELDPVDTRTTPNAAPSDGTENQDDERRADASPMSSQVAGPVPDAGAGDSGISDAASEGDGSDECPQGFQQNGTQCEDVNECFEDEGACHPTASCVNSEGSYDCVCRDGYSGGGIKGFACMPRIAGGLGHACAVTPDDVVVCWGDNGVGQLGDGTFSSRMTASPVPNLGAAAGVVASDFTSCAILQSGKVACWGQGAGSRWGEGSATPAVIEDLENVIQLSINSTPGADAAICAIDGSGTIWCWGELFEGFVDRPRRVDLSGAVWVSVGYGASGDPVMCATIRDGSAYCWGSGMLTGPETTSSATPLQVPLTQVRLIRPFFQRVCAITGSRGTVMCWGTPSLIDSDDSSGPVGISLVGRAYALNGGYTHTCVIDALSGLKCWDVYRDVSAIEGGSDVVSMTTSVAGVYGLTSSGEAKVWDMSSETGPRYVTSLSIQVW